MAMAGWFGLGNARAARGERAARSPACEMTGDAPRPSPWPWASALKGVTGEVPARLQEV